MSRASKPEWQKRIARERIRNLFSQADQAFNQEPDKAHKYVAMARRIAMRYNVRIPGELRKSYCKKCYKYLKANINSRVRANSKQKALVVTCLECGNVMRYPYRKKGSSD